jgi:hypothetical protein
MFWVRYCKLRTISYIARQFLQRPFLLLTDCCCVQSDVLVRDSARFKHKLMGFMVYF